jgi:hypothetical protein
MDGGANICAESTHFFSKNEIRFIWSAIRTGVLYCRSIANAHRFIAELS